MRGSSPLARIMSSTLREVPHFGLCQMVTRLAAIRLELFGREPCQVFFLAAVFGAPGAPHRVSSMMP